MYMLANAARIADPAIARTAAVMHAIREPDASGMVREALRSSAPETQEGKTNPNPHQAVMKPRSL